MVLRGQPRCQPRRPGSRGFFKALGRILKGFSSGYPRGILAHMRPRLTTSVFRLCCVVVVFFAALHPACHGDPLEIGHVSSKAKLYALADRHPGPTLPHTHEHSSSPHAHGVPQPSGAPLKSFSYQPIADGVPAVDCVSMLFQYGSASTLSAAVAASDRPRAGPPIVRQLLSSLAAAPLAPPARL